MPLRVTTERMSLCGSRCSPRSDCRGPEPRGVPGADGARQRLVQRRWSGVRQGGPATLVLGHPAPVVDLLPGRDFRGQGKSPPTSLRPGVRTGPAARATDAVRHYGERASNCQDLWIVRYWLFALEVGPRVHRG